jgi:hypothetical protein
MFYVDFSFSAGFVSDSDSSVNLIFQHKLVWLVICIPASDVLIESHVSFPNASEWRWALF